MSLVEALDAYQRRHRRVGFPLAVLYKFADDQGGYLAALLTYYGFLSLFPLLLLLVTVLGHALAGDPQAQLRVLDSALSQVPVLGRQIRDDVQGLQGSTSALVTGVLGSLYGGIGVAQAGQNAMNTLWAVPRHRRPNPFLSRLRSLVAVLALGTGLVLTTVLSGLVASVDAAGVGAAGRVLGLLVALVGNAALFLAGFRMLTVERVPFRALVPGALAAAVGWQVLQAVGGYLVTRTLSRASEVYGVFGVVLGLFVFLYAAALITLVCAEVNVVRARRLWPRSLLTPFTDDVELTPADERSYEGMATSQKTKGFEEVDVSFDGDGR
jgi:membrane protein